MTTSRKGRTGRRVGSASGRSENWVKVRRERTADLAVWSLDKHVDGPRAAAVQLGTCIEVRYEAWQVPQARKAVRRLSISAVAAR